MQRYNEPTGDHAGMERDDDGDWVRHTDADAELSALRARVAELEAMQAALHLGIASDAGIIRELRARVESLQVELDLERAITRGKDERLATLESPPVVPEGWIVTRSGLKELRKWVTHQDGTFSSRCYRPEDLLILRAVIYAIEHDQRPPHASDGKEGGE